MVRLLALAIAVSSCLHTVEAKTLKSQDLLDDSTSSSDESSSSKKQSSGKSRSSAKSHTSSSKRKGSKKATPPPVPAYVELKTQDYPAEIAGRLADYNTKLNEVKALHKKDPAMEKARGEVLKIEKESFDLYKDYIAASDPKRIEKIRATVASRGWTKGMPKIAFIVSMGLPDDIETVPSRDGSSLRLIYNSTSYYFEKGVLRSVKK